MSTSRLTSTILIAIALTGRLQAQGSTDVDYSSAVADARMILSGPIGAGEYPGLAVSVAVDSEIVYEEGFGFARIDPPVPATSSQPFRIYSIAKTLTGVAALKLAEEGRLDLDAPIERYIPTLDERLRGIIARQLAGHLSGIRHYRKGEWMRLAQNSCQSPMDAIAPFEHDKLEHPPGQTGRYSSFGYVLLSAVIEAAAGESYAAYMSEAIFEPAGMVTIRPANPDAEGQQQVGFYRGRKNFTELGPIDNSCKFGAGGFIASSDDLARFGIALLGGRILEPTSLEIMLTTMNEASGEPTEYGFGIGLGTDEDGRRYGQHSGGAPGGRAAFVVYPDQKVVVAIVANSEGERLTDEAHAIARAFMETD